MKQSKTYKAVIILFCCALAVSLYFNFKSPYLPQGKAEHLGKLTYNLPVDGKWVYADFGGGTGNDFPGKNGIVCVDGNDGQVLGKGYVDMDSMATLTVEYDISDSDAVKGKGKWNTENGDIPDNIDSIVIDTDDDSEEVIGTYWRALVSIGGERYLISVENSAFGTSTPYYDGQEVVRSLAVDNSLEDEYDKD